MVEIPLIQGVSPLFHNASHLCEVASNSLLSAAWEAGLLAVAVTLALKFLPRSTASVRAAAWTAALAVLILLPFLPAMTRPAAGAAYALPGKLHLDSRWSFGLAGIWAVLSLIRAIGLSHSALRLRTLHRRATPVPQIPRGGLVLRNPGSRGAVLCTSSDVQRPSVIGFFSPRILIPSGLYPRLSPAELEQIVLHESEHLRRGDDWINLLQQIGLVLFPLNPALLWVERRLCLERELACDEGVLRVTGSAKSYAACLVNLAEHGLRGRQISLALGAWGRQSELARRVQDILNLPAKTMGRRQAAAFVSLLLVGLVGGATALARSPQLVSFATHSPSAASAQNSAAVSVGVLRPHVQAVSFPGRQVASAPRLVHAVMRVGTVAATTTAKRPSAKPPFRPRSFEKCVARKRNLGRSTLLLTSWSGFPRPEGQTTVSPRFALAIFDDPATFSSYAAVPTSDGWLIVQL